jgi:hypothetical protein
MNTKRRQQPQAQSQSTELPEADFQERIAALGRAHRRKIEQEAKREFRDRFYQHLNEFWEATLGK